MMYLVIFLSCGFLVDAFRLLSKQKPQKQAISKMQASLLSIAFLVFGAAILVRDFAFFEGNYTFFAISAVLQNFFFLLSCLIIAFILSNLTHMQSAQVQRLDHSTELDASINSAESVLT